MSTNADSALRILREIVHGRDRALADNGHIRPVEWANEAVWERARKLVYEAEMRKQAELYDLMAQLAKASTPEEKQTCRDALQAAHAQEAK